MQKTGRNDPCPCGSGKKYKKCCEMQAKSKKLNASVLPSTETLSIGMNRVSSLFFKSQAVKNLESAEVPVSAAQDS
jgi:hypothetical protein